MPTIAVLDAAGDPQAIEVPNTNGRRGATLSRPVVLSDEDFAAFSAAVLSLEDILSALLSGLNITNTPNVNVTGGNVSATFDSYPGLTDAQLRGLPLSVVDGSTRIPYVQTVVTGTGSAVTVLAANANRKGIVFLPAGAANDWIYNFNGTAASGASPLYPPAGGPFVLAGRFCPSGALSLLGTSGQKLVVWEFA